MAELPVLDETRCTGCADCVAVCPTDCLAMNGPAPWMPRPLDCVCVHPLCARLPHGSAAHERPGRGLKKTIRSASKNDFPV